MVMLCIVVNHSGHGLSEPLSVSGLIQKTMMTITNCCGIMSPSDVRDKYNQTPLHRSCDGGLLGRFNLSTQMDLVRYLVERTHCDISEYLTCSYNTSTSNS